MWNKILMKNNEGKRSATLSAFVFGFIVVNVKLIFSGMTLMGLTLSPFTGSEYAMAVAALGAVYVLRKGTDPEAKNKPKENTDGK